MLSLFSEIIISILGASLLGLFAGVMIQKSLNKRKMAGIIATWEDRLQDSEDDAKRDSEHLEDQLQSLGGEVKTLLNKNRSLESALKDNQAEGTPATTHQPHAQPTEIESDSSDFSTDNDTDTETNSKNLGITAAAVSAVSAAPDKSLIDKTVERFEDDLTIEEDTVVTELKNNLAPDLEDQTELIDNEIQRALEVEADHAETIAFSSTMSDTLEETALMGTTAVHTAVDSSSGQKTHDDTLDTTAELADNSLAMEEQTVALDEEALALVRRPRDHD